MNKYITSSVFLAAGLAALNVGAQNNQALKGSDTLYEVTKKILNACPGAAGLSYLGTGSGNGEKALIPGPTMQNIAPMSRFLNGSAVCNASGTNAGTGEGVYTQFDKTTVVTNAAGIVCGIDGIGVYGSKKTAGKETCGGPAVDGTTITWSAGTYLTHGGACSGSATASYAAGSYVINDWTDVLRIVYAGMDHCAGSTIANQNCGSDVRAALVQNWGKIFQNGSTSDACTTSTDPNGVSTCTQLRHALRRDDYSGTTDTFLALLGLPGIGRSSSNQVLSDPFCNSTQYTGGAGSHALPANVNNAQPDYRDRDPIQRCAAGSNVPARGQTTPPTNAATEQISSRTGKLGVVLPINPMSDALKNNQQPNPYPVKICTTTTVLGSAPPVDVTATGDDQVYKTVNRVNYYGRCPSGDASVLGGQCLIPVDDTGDPNCMATRDSRPGFVVDTANLVEGVGAGAADARAYSLHMYIKSGANAVYATDVNGHRITGAFSRLHATRNMNLPNTSVGDVCTSLDATDQIGCLVAADHCSIGYAGRGAASATANLGTAAMPIKGLLPTDSNLLSFSYPMVRKLYLNSIIPASSLWGQELAYAQCYISQCGTAMTEEGFLGVPARCEDFNEDMLCSGGMGGKNKDACGSLQTALGFTGNTVSCGNGVKEDYEDCDDSAASFDAVSGKWTITSNNNGACPKTCSNTCRFNVCKPTSCT